MGPMQIIFSQCIITNVQKGLGEAAVVAAAAFVLAARALGCVLGKGREML
jgi:hypothetical protein